MAADVEAIAACALVFRVLIVVKGKGKLDEVSGYSDSVRGNLLLNT